MPLFAVALVVRKSQETIELLKAIPVLVAADCERDAGKEAKREARKTYPKSEGWHIVGKVVEVDRSKLLQMIMTNDNHSVFSLSSKASETIH